MNDTIPDEELEPAYFNRLKVLVEVCEACTAGGLAYMTVLLGHELARFLYPIEPYAGFRHEQPALHLIAHLDRLIALGRAALAGVTGYPPAPAVPLVPACGTVEAATSALYTSLWRGFDRAALVEESRRLIERRIPPEVIAKHIVGRSVLDMGCGSGRYTLALALLGARRVTAVDYFDFVTFRSPRKRDIHEVSHPSL